MPDRQLTPATLDDVRESLAYALRYSRSGKRVADRDSLMASAAAETIFINMVVTFTEIGDKDKGNR